MYMELNISILVYKLIVFYIDYLKYIMIFENGEKLWIFNLIVG